MLSVDTICSLLGRPSAAVHRPCVLATIVCSRSSVVSTMTSWPSSCRRGCHRRHVEPSAACRRQALCVSTVPAGYVHARARLAGFRRHADRRGGQPRRGAGSTRRAAGNLPGGPPRHRAARRDRRRDVDRLQRRGPLRRYHEPLGRPRRRALPWAVGCRLPRGAERRGRRRGRPTPSARCSSRTTAGSR